MRAVRSGLIAALVWAGFACSAHGQTPSPDVARLSPGVSPESLATPDPTVERGVLPNGLRYAIKQQPSHQKEVIRFYIEAGSFDEPDGAAGVAHFLEHMAFNGSAHFPAATLIKKFETAGIDFGHDQNAHTTTFGTVYELSIPNLEPDKLDLSFLWLQDVASGLSLDPAEIDRERGVIMQEYAVNFGGEKTDVAVKVGFFLPDLRASSRLPIGHPQTIAKIDAPTVRDFYQRWYRPDNTIIVAVGDEPATAIKARIEAAFGAWRNPGPAPVRADPGKVDLSRPAGLKNLIDANAATALQICRFTPRTPPGPLTVAVAKARIADAIWRIAFNERMARLARQDRPPLFNATADYEVKDRVIGQTCVSAVALLQDWPSAMAAIAQETARMEAYGLTQREFDYAKAQILAASAAAIKAEPTLQADGVAANILSKIIDEEPYISAAESDRLTRRALAALTPADARGAFHDHWAAGSAALGTVTTNALVGSPRLMAQWGIDEALPRPDPPSDPAKLVWRYGPAARPGQVIAREVQTAPDFVRLRFANGVVLNFKQTDFARNEVDIRISFGAGGLETPPGALYPVLLAESVLLRGAYKRNDFSDLLQVCEGRRCGARLTMSRDSFQLAGATRSQDLGVELQVLNGLVAEPGFRPSLASAIPSIVSQMMLHDRRTPLTVAAWARDDALPQPHVAETPSEAVLSKLSADDIAALLKGPLTQDALEVTIVGDIDEATAVARVAETLGALPPRRELDHVRPDAVRRRYATSPPPLITTYHRGTAIQAAVLITWPVFAWTPADRHRTRVLNLLARIMQDQTLARVREKLGGAYSPEVAVSMPRGGDQGAIVMSVDTTPEAEAAVRAEALAIAKDLAAGDFTQADLEQARRPLLEEAAKARTYNTWWLDLMDGSARWPEQVAAARTRDQDIAAIPLEEVKAAARTWLGAQPYVVRALPSPPPTPATKSAG